MTDFIHKLHEHLSVRSAQAKRVRPSEVISMSLHLVSDQLAAQEKQFQKRLGKVSDKAREKMQSFADELKISHEKIIATLEVVHQLMLVSEEKEGSLMDSYAKMLGQRIESNKHKTKILSKDYPPAQQQEEEVNELNKQFTLSSMSHVTMICHGPKSIEPCTPENDNKLDHEIKYTLRDLFQSLEKSLTHFQINYSKQAEEQTNETVGILIYEYRRAKQRIMEETPTLQQILRMKEVEAMVRNTLSEKIHSIRQKRRLAQKGST